jgi:hypothetical protein
LLRHDPVTGFRSVRAADRALHWPGKLSMQRLDIEFIFRTARAKDFDFHETPSLISGAQDIVSFTYGKQ